MYDKEQEIWDKLEESLMKLRAAFDQLIAIVTGTLETVADVASETAPATARSEEIKPNTIYDFSCHCPATERLDRLPWYTSGFQ